MIAVRREEIPQAELFELGVTKMPLETDHMLEIVRPDFDARLADLERGLRHRMLPLLGDEHAQLRRFHPQLPREASAREAAAQNCDIVMTVRLWVRHGPIL